jgi:hypothetical protein
MHFEPVNPKQFYFVRYEWLNSISLFRCQWCCLASPFIFSLFFKMVIMPDPVISMHLISFDFLLQIHCLTISSFFSSVTDLCSFFLDAELYSFIFIFTMFRNCKKKNRKTIHSTWQITAVAWYTLTITILDLLCLNQPSTMTGWVWGSCVIESCFFS